MTEWIWMKSAPSVLMTCKKCVITRFIYILLKWLQSASCLPRLNIIKHACLINQYIFWYTAVPFHCFKRQLHRHFYSQHAIQLTNTPDCAFSLFVWLWCYWAAVTTSSPWTEGAPAQHRSHRRTQAAGTGQGPRYIDHSFLFCCVCSPQHWLCVELFS